MSEMWNSPDKFNREALLWDENPRRRSLALAVAKAIIASVNPAKTMRAMEFGCGTGLVTLEIAPLVRSVSAIDTSSEMLAVLSQKIQSSQRANIETTCVDLSQSPDFMTQHAKRFDLIYSSMTLHHVDDTAGFLNKISNLLSPGGLIALADLDHEDGSFHDDPLEKVHHGFDRTVLAIQLKAAGLENILFETIYTLEKVNSSGVSASYPVFLVTATRAMS